MISDVQESNSVTLVSVLFQIIFPFRLLYNIKQSSLCYTIGPFWLFILNDKNSHSPSGEKNIWLAQ